MGFIWCTTEYDKCFHLFWKEGGGNGGLFHQTPPYLAPKNYATKILDTNKKIRENSKYQRTGNIRMCDVTSNPRVTRRSDNHLKGIWNPDSQDPYNLFKGIRNLVLNGTRNPVVDRIRCINLDRHKVV